MRRWWESYSDRPFRLRICTTAIKLGDIRSKTRQRGRRARKKSMRLGERGGRTRDGGKSRGPPRMRVYAGGAAEEGRRNL